MRKESKYNKPLLDLAEELLDENNVLRIRATGLSMFPSFRDGDICYVEKCQLENLKTGDMIVCRRNNTLIMHRLKKLVKKDGEYQIFMRGDNILRYDEPFSGNNFVAKVSHFVRDGKTIQVDSPKLNFYKFIDQYFHPVSCRFSQFYLRISHFSRFFKSSFHSLRKNIKSLLEGSEKSFRINSFIALLKGIAPLAMIVCIKFLIDFLSQSTIETTEQKWMFFGLLGATAFLFLSSGLLNQIGGYFGEKMSQSVTRKVYDDLHRKHVQLELGDFENAEKLDQMHRAVQEVSYRPDRILNSALGFIKTLSTGILLLAVFVSIRWYLMLILLAAVLPETIFRILYVRKLYHLKEKQRADEREKYYYNRVLTGFPFAKEIRLFGFSDYFLRLFNKKQNTIFTEKLALTKYEMRLSIVSQVFAVLLIFTSLGIVSFQKISGTMSMGTVVLFFFAFQRGYAIMNEFFRSTTGLIEDNTFLNDFLSFLKLPDRQNRKGNALQPFSFQKEISIENVHFRYEGSAREALSDVSIKIPKGKTIALVGENGSGKTTLVKLLCGFYPPEKGEILFDGISSESFSQKQLLSNITAVFQDFALYQVSVLDNILLGKIDSKPDVELAQNSAGKVGMHEILENLPHGYQTRLGHLFKDSEELSIGQWQKLAIARAFYRDAPLLIMDEPSSALDVFSEQQIIENLKLLSKNKTTLIVSHRLSTVQWADCIYLLDEGKVAESGTHDELMNLNGKYAELFRMAKKME